MGINVVEDEEKDKDREEGKEEEEEEGGDMVEEGGKDVEKKKKKKEKKERKEDKVRMYMREMGQVEILQREGEIEIEKRIEEGREKMIEGICERKMRLKEIIIWREKIKE